MSFMTIALYSNYVTGKPLILERREPSGSEPQLDQLWPDVFHPACKLLLHCSCAPDTSLWQVYSDTLEPLL